MDVTLELSMTGSTRHLLVVLFCSELHARFVPPSLCLVLYVASLFPCMVDWTTFLEGGRDAMSFDPRGAVSHATGSGAAETVPHPTCFDERYWKSKRRI